MTAWLVVGRPGVTEVLLILGVLLVPAAVVAFVVWIVRRAHRAEPPESED